MTVKEPEMAMAGNDLGLASRPYQLPNPGASPLPRLSRVTRSVP